MDISIYRGGFAQMRLACVLMTLILAAACSKQEKSSDFLDRIPSPADLPIVYRPDVQQGTVLTQDMLAQLEKGMDRDKVRFIMGTPPIEDVFHPDRWDYLYSYKEGSSRREQRRVTLHFIDDKLAYITGDIKPAEGLLEPQLRHDKVVDVPNSHKKDGLLKAMAAKVGLGEDGPEFVPTEPDAQIEPGTDDNQEQSEDGRDAAGSGETAETSKKRASVEAPPAPKHEEDKGFFGRMADRLGLGGKSRDEELIHRDPTAEDPLDR
jgi:outer membrane protein assembly factor BamE